MGWASYLEDINDRLEQDLAAIGNFGTRSVRSSLSSAPICPHEAILERIEAFLVTARRTKKDIETLLELATDPAADLASKSLELSTTVDNQQKLLISLQKDIEQRAKRILVLEDYVNGARKERDDWKRKHDRLQAQVSGNPRR